MVGLLVDSRTVERRGGEGSEDRKRRRERGICVDEGVEGGKKKGCVREGEGEGERERGGEECVSDAVGLFSIITQQRIAESRRGSQRQHLATGKQNDWKT